MSVFRTHTGRRSAFGRRVTSRRIPSPGPALTLHPASAPTPAALPFSAVRNITAAAKPINLRDSREVARLAKRRVGDAWQHESWEYYDAIGEIKYAFTLVGNILSRLRLYAGETSDPSVAPKPVDPDSPGGGAAEAALRRLDSAFGGQVGLLRDAALNLSVAGECYLVQIPANPILQINESWDIRSTDEVEVKADGSVWLVTRPGGEEGTRKKLPPNAFIARIWRPHPRYSDEADCSMRSLLDMCAELLLLDKTFRATARSRLNAGLLYLPDGLSVAASPDPDVVPDDDDPEQFIDPTLSSDDDDEDDFEEALIEAMTTPIADEESASAVVPLLVRGPAELGDKLRLIQFQRSFDPELTTRSHRVMDRIMQGLDIPKDIVAGLANVKYTNAQQIDDSLMKSHVEPMALLICDALTIVYLRPALRAAGISEDEANNFVVWYDATEVTAKPNRADDSDKGYLHSIVSGATWRREHGFQDTDAPTPEEIAVRMLVDKGPITPELAESLLTVIAPNVMDRVRQASQAANPAPLPDDVTQALGGPVSTGTAPSASPDPSDPATVPDLGDSGEHPPAPPKMVDTTKSSPSSDKIRSTPPGMPNPDPSARANVPSQINKEDMY